MKQGLADLDRVKEKHTKEIEDRVRKLIENCKRRQAQMTDEELDREFDEMWKKTLRELKMSNKNKDKFCADFKDCLMKRPCQKKAEEFTEQGLRGAVENSINRSLGVSIIDKMLTCEEFSTRVVFQCTVLEDLLEKDCFDDFLKYTTNYEDYVKDWILNKIMSHSTDVFDFENKHIQSCVRSINEAVDKAIKGPSDTIQSFITDICKELNDKLVISKEALDAFMVLNNADKEKFARCLEESVKEMGQSLQNKLNMDIKEKLQSLHVKPRMFFLIESLAVVNSAPSVMLHVMQEEVPTLSTGPLCIALKHLEVSNGNNLKNLTLIYAHQQ
ncbi:hypothetical protein WMY93_014063 [Mugilogobius chulae]|uniref:Uncharacterized protein n=1 Tax=Mugilogobius chulae TaxID=88201 RepID=A0AAW0NVY1_9GOBI